MTREQLAAAGFELDPTSYEALRRFVRLLLEECRRVNLTGAKTEAEVWRIHICDSLVLLPLLQRAGVRDLLDLGSGGGFPGIPLACASSLAVTLLDATRKKVEAVRRIGLCLGLSNLKVVWGRAEILAHDPAYRERFDGVTARAVAALPVLVEYAAGFVRTGGHAWFYKSASAAESECMAAENAVRTCRLKHVDTVRYRLPGEHDDRVLLDFRKEGPVPDRLPRKSGQAVKRPL